MESWDMLLQVILLLLACLAGGSLMARLGQSPLAGYLLAGMIVGGPGSLGMVQAEKQIDGIAELGVALLLFSLGLEFSWQRLVGLGAARLLSGFGQVVLTLVVVAAGSMLIGMSFRTAIVAGAMISLSSTAAVLRVLMERGELDSATGRNALAILLVQDMAVVPLAILIPLLGSGGEPSVILRSVLMVSVAAVAVVGTLHVVLNQLAVRAWKSAPVARNRELSVLLAVIVGLGATWAAHAVGVSPALGAFVAGMFLGNSQFALQVRADVSSLRMILLTLFFGAVGMVADPIWMLKHLPQIAGFVFVILAVKTSVIWLLLWRTGQPGPIALASGLTLSQIGEFSFVLGGEAKSVGLLTDETYASLVSAAIVSLLATPWLIRAAPRLAERLTPRRRIVAAGTAGHVDESHAGPPIEVLVIGFGPAGRGAVSQLLTERSRIAIVELSPDGAAAAAAQGFHVIVGDATSPDVLEHLPLATIRTVVISLPSRQDSLTILNHVRTLMPHATTIVRSRYQLFMRDFEQAGADIVVGDESEVGASFARVVAESLAESAQSVVAEKGTAE